MQIDNTWLAHNIWFDGNKSVHCSRSTETDMRNLYVDILLTYLPLVRVWIILSSPKSNPSESQNK